MEGHCFHPFRDTPLGSSHVFKLYMYLVGVQGSAQPVSGVGLAHEIAAAVNHYGLDARHLIGQKRNG